MPFDGTLLQKEHSGVVFVLRQVPGYVLSILTRRNLECAMIYLCARGIDWSRRQLAKEEGEYFFRYNM